MVGNLLKISFFNSRIFQKSGGAGGVSTCTIFPITYQKKNARTVSLPDTAALLSSISAAGAGFTQQSSGGTGTTSRSYIQFGCGIGNSGRFHTESRMGWGKRPPFSSQNEWLPPTHLDDCWWWCLGIIRWTDVEKYHHLLKGKGCRKVDWLIHFCVKASYERNRCSSVFLLR